jgi:hypothetical protein
LHNISPSTVDHDISLFLEYHLGIIRQECFLGMDWPGRQTVRDMIQKAGGLFIWAATACRFIREGRRFATKRLAQILRGDTAKASPEEKLNKIYRTILMNCIRDEYDDLEKEELYKTFKEVVGTIVILSFGSFPLSSTSLGRLLQFQDGDVDRTLDDMRSILEIPIDKDQPIRLHHPSFRDFLLDKQRCNDQRFWVDEQKAHGALLDCCIRLMSNKLKRDICDLDAPNALAANLRSDQMAQCLPAELQYACRYWVQHLQRSGTPLHDDGPIHSFMRHHFLHWLEALSLMRNTPDVLVMVRTLESMITVSNSTMLQYSPPG